MFDEIISNKVLVGQEAPSFLAKAYMPDGTIRDEFNLFNEIDNKYAVLVFYPLDFTFVCPTEIIEYNKLIPEFKKLDALVIGISVDSVFSHKEWCSRSLSECGIGNLDFPLISDLSKQISTDYGVLYNDEVALRATVIIDKHKVIRHMVINDLPIGRNTQDSLRTLEALIHVEKYGQVCQANWQAGDKALIANSEDVINYLKTMEDWFK